MIAINSDSTGKLFISTLRDSLKVSNYITNKTINNYGDEPQISFAEKAISIDQSNNSFLHFRLTIHCRKNPAYHVNLKVGVATIDNKKFAIINPFAEYMQNGTMAKDIDNGFGIYAPSKFSRYYFYVIVSFEDSQAKKLLYEEVLALNMDDFTDNDTYSLLTSPYKEQVAKLFQ